MPASSKKNTGKTIEDRPPNRNVKKDGVLEADPVNADITKKIIICKICTSIIPYKDENALLIHLLMFHFKVSSIGYF